MNNVSEEEPNAINYMQLQTQASLGITSGNYKYMTKLFGKGIIFPIFKDGDRRKPLNYRGITLSHVFSFLFDHAIQLKIDHLLLTDDLQFGYKKKHSCNHAIFTVKKCINYFRDHGSTLPRFYDSRHMLGQGALQTLASGDGRTDLTTYAEANAHHQAARRRSQGS